MFNQKENMYVISAIQSIKMYSYLKNTQFQSFMSWAFGDFWESAKLTELPSLWNSHHELLPKIHSPKTMLDTLLPMVDWYIQVNKIQE